MSGEVNIVLWMVVIVLSVNFEALRTDVNNWLRCFVIAISIPLSAVCVARSEESLFTR